MKIVVIGGTGRLGSEIVSTLREHGQEALPAAPSLGVDTITGEGLSGALAGAAAVIDVSNSPSFEDAAVLEFFETSTRNLLDAGADAGVAHHVALSVVGADRLPESGYLRAKVAQENLIKASGRPYSIVRATQFFEFLHAIADAATDGDTVRVPPALMQPIAAADLAKAVGRIAVGRPLNDVVEVAGPDAFAMDELLRKGLEARRDQRHVVADLNARYFGTTLERRSLLPGEDAQLGETRLHDWLPAVLAGATR